MQGNKNAGTITDRKHALAAEDLALVFKEIGQHTLFVKSYVRVTKGLLIDLRKAICANGWQDEFPVLGSCEKARAV
jgi:hypothetical protein